MGLGDTTTFFNHFIYDEHDNGDTKTIQYFIMHGMGLCIKVDSYVVHMLHEWSFGHNKEVLISSNKKKYFISLNTYTTVLAWGVGHSNKHRI